MDKQFADYGEWEKAFEFDTFSNSIRWIEQFLLGWSHELILITHDRSFMDRLVTHTLGIHRRKIRKIAGDTAKYYSQIAQDDGRRGWRSLRMTRTTRSH